MHLPSHEFHHGLNKLGHILHRAESDARKHFDEAAAKAYELGKAPTTNFDRPTKGCFAALQQSISNDWSSMSQTKLVLSIDVDIDLLDDLNLKVNAGDGRGTAVLKLQLWTMMEEFGGAFLVNR